MKFVTHAFLLLMFMSTAMAAIDAYQFPNDELQARYYELIEQLRCPQCLNTNIAGSDAMIAKGLRRETHRLLLEGKSDDEILEFMRTRYGDFILYNPRVTLGTAVLWFGPPFFVVIAIIILVSIVRRRRELKKPKVNVQKLHALLAKHQGEER